MLSRVSHPSVYFTLTVTFPTHLLLLQVVLELCQSKQVTDRETVDMHLERIRSLVSTWAAQVSCRLSLTPAWLVFLYLSCFVFLPHHLSNFHSSPVSPRSSFQNPPLWIRLSCC